MMFFLIKEKKYAFSLKVNLKNDLFLAKCCCTSWNVSVAVTGFINIYTLSTRRNKYNTHTAVARATWLKVWRVAVVFFVCLFLLKRRKFSDVYFLVSRCPRREQYLYEIFDCAGFGNGFRATAVKQHRYSSTTHTDQVWDSHARTRTHTHTYTHKHKALKTLTKIQHKLLFLAYINMLFLMLWIYYTMFFFFHFFISII